MNVRKALLILNGAGLADLSSDDDVTLEQIKGDCSVLCNELGMDLEFRQTDDSAEMTRWIANDGEEFGALIINPGGLNLGRPAIDRIARMTVPVIEVHADNIFREDAEPAKPLQGPEGETGFICGLGLHSYLLGIRAVAKRLQAN